MNDGKTWIWVRRLVRVDGIVGDTVYDRSLTVVGMVVPWPSNDTYRCRIANEPDTRAVGYLYRHLEGEADRDRWTRSEVEKIDAYSDDDHQGKCDVNSTL